MARTARASRGDICYHVMNRGNGRLRVFHKPDDYQSFLDLIGAGCDRLPMRVLGYVLMPNHFHLVLWPHKDGDLSSWMQWLLTSHVRRHARTYRTTGHIWQGRFKAFPIEEDDHLQVVIRYVERNPLRAKLVERAQDWAWSSLPARARKAGPDWLSPTPEPLPPNWKKWVNQPLTQAETDHLQRSLKRGSPFGSETWTTKTAQLMGLTSTIKPRGRPSARKEK